VSSAFLAAGWAVDAAAPRANFETGGLTGSSGPVKVMVVYGHPEDVEIFEGHYRTRHIPLARRMPFCASVEGARAVSDAAGEKASFYRIATLSFDTEADMLACMASEVGQAAFADITNFATGGATATIVTDIQTFQPVPDVNLRQDVAGPGRYEQRLPE
jgi:uncharacterized protein (TIGR02118 family)